MKLKELLELCSYTVVSVVEKGNHDNRILDDVYCINISLIPMIKYLDMEVVSVSTRFVYADCEEDDVEGTGLFIEIDIPKNEDYDT